VILRPPERTSPATGLRTRRRQNSGGTSSRHRPSRPRCNLLVGTSPDSSHGHLSATTTSENQRWSECKVLQNRPPRLARPWNAAPWPETPWWPIRPGQSGSPHHHHVSPPLLEHSLRVTGSTEAIGLLTGERVKHTFYPSSAPDSARPELTSRRGRRDRMTSSCTAGFTKGAFFSSRAAVSPWGRDL